MRPLAIALPCLALLAACASTAAHSISDPLSPRVEAAVADSSMIVTGVSIVDPMSGSTSAPQDVLIEAGRIAAIAPSGTLTVPAGTPHVDGAGRFAMAGLIDVHAHVGEGGIAPGDDATRARALRQFLRYGVTTLFVPGATGAGDADFPALRERCRAVIASCPGLYGAGSLITAPGSHPV